MSQVAAVDRGKLETTVVKTLREVAQYSSGKIEQELELGINTAGDEAFLSAWGRVYFEICNDRRLCGFLGADYNNLPAVDINRIKVAALYLVREDPEIVLPWL